MPTTQPEFDYLFPRSKPYISLKEFAAKMGLSLDTAWKLYLSGQIYGNSHNTDLKALEARGSKNETRFRYMRRICRESAIAYAIKTADFDQPMRLQSALDVAEPLTRDQLIELATHCHRKAQS